MAAPPSPLAALDLIDSLVQLPAWSRPPPAAAILPPSLLDTLSASSASLLPASQADPTFQPFLDTVRECGRPTLAKCNVPCPPAPAAPTPDPSPLDEDHHAPVMTEDTKTALLTKIDGFVTLYKTRLKPWTAPLQPTYVSKTADLGKVARAYVGAAIKVKDHVDHSAHMLKRLRKAEKMHPAAMGTSSKATRRRSSGVGSRKRRNSAGRRRESGSRASSTTATGTGS